MGYNEWVNTVEKLPMRATLSAVVGPPVYGNQIPRWFENAAWQKIWPYCELQLRHNTQNWIVKKLHFCNKWLESLEATKKHIKVFSMLLPAFTWKQMQVCVSEIRNLHSAFYPKLKEFKQLSSHVSNHELMRQNWTICKN